MEVRIDMPPKGEVEKHNEPIKNIIKSSYTQLDVVDKENTSMNRKLNIFTSFKYITMVISLGLDFAPAFIPALQSNWYSVPTVSFSLMVLLMEIYLDKESFERKMMGNSVFKNRIEKIIQSVKRKIGKRSMDGVPLTEEYIKRVESQLTDVIMYRGL